MPVQVSIPSAPVEYDRRTFDEILKQLRLLVNQINNPGPISGTTITLSDLPTSAAGLPSGSVWVDTGAGNVLKIVP